MLMCVCTSICAGAWSCRGCGESCVADGAWRSVRGEDDGRRRLCRVWLLAHVTKPVRAQARVMGNEMTREGGVSDAEKRWGIERSRHVRASVRGRGGDRPAALTEEPHHFDNNRERRKKKGAGGGSIRVAVRTSITVCPPPLTSRGRRGVFGQAAASGDACWHHCLPLSFASVLVVEAPCCALHYLRVRRLHPHR